MVRIHGTTVANKKFPCDHCNVVLHSKRHQVEHTKEVHGVEL